MKSLVTVSPVITVFHSCCLSHHVFWPSKPLAGLGRIWNRYLLTMLTWNRRDSTPLSAAPRAPKDGFFGHKNPYLVFHSPCWRRPEVKFGQNVVKKETTQKKTTKMRTKSPLWIKINSQIKKPHLKMIPTKDNYLFEFKVFRYKERDTISSSNVWHISSTPKTDNLPLDSNLN